MAFMASLMALPIFALRECPELGESGVIREIQDPFRLIVNLADFAVARQSPCFGELTFCQAEFVISVS